MTGTIKKLTDKGFGFISSPDMEKDVFFHRNALVDVTFEQLHEGDTVSFESEESEKGLNAVNVKLASAGAASTSAPEETEKEETEDDQLDKAA